MDKSVLSVYKLVKAPIYSHCLSQDKSLLAITCENNCLIYRLGGRHPQLVATLENHDKTVTAVDISVHGRIVTCSQDRNAYVWEPLSDGSYRPTLVLLRINRAATCVSWAPNGYKFAVGSSARIIAVCYYEQENNWWVSKHIKKPIKSTVNCLSWHENGVLLASGGTDGFMRIFSGFIKGLDSKETMANSPWGSKFPFGSLIKEQYQGGAYIHDVQWRSNIEKVAYVAHDGTLDVLDYQGNLQSVNAPDGLPYRALLWINDHEILCAGYNCHPVMFSEASQGWKFARDYDKIAAANVLEKTATGSSTSSSQFGSTQDEDNDENPTFGISALRKFKELDLKGKVSLEQKESAHENAIVSLIPYAESNGQITQVSSCGLDGKVVLYNI
ncbi:actin-related protein 2/3 complex subunit 1 [Monosporozyma unispora]|nr:actin- protein 2/3 complex subunit 1 [Kazachstania unispora]